MLPVRHPFEGPETLLDLGVSERIHLDLVPVPLGVEPNRTKRGPFLGADEHDIGGIAAILIVFFVEKGFGRRNVVDQGRVIVLAKFLVRNGLLPAVWNQLVQGLFRIKEGLAVNLR